MRYVVDIFDIWMCSWEFSWVASVATEIRWGVASFIREISQTTGSLSMTCHKDATFGVTYPPNKEVKWAEIKELALKFWINWLKWCSRDLLLTWSPSSCFWLVITSSLITTHCCHFRNMLSTFPESLSVTPKFWLFGHYISLLGILSSGLVGHFSCKSVPPRSHLVSWKSTWQGIFLLLKFLKLV